MKTICPKCGNEAVSQPSVSPDYVLLKCYNQIKIIDGRKKEKSIQCGFEEFVKIQPIDTATQPPGKGE